ncbi:MAG: ammonium transporter [Bacteroidota bacterium]
MSRNRSLLLAALFVAPAALAQDSPDAGVAAAETVQVNLNYVWTIIAAAMVFFMQAGFALLETGFTRAKNAANIIMKNVMDVGAGSLVFFAVGFALMFGTTAGGWIGTDGFFLKGIEGQDQSWIYAFFFFQAVFAATAATIVSGAVAERTKFTGYLMFSILLTGLIYPVFGSWAWGGLFNGSGWLEGLGFIDFAGSTVVHSVGGWAALAAAIVVGPRMGKYIDGKAQPMPGHSLPQAALGVFILWLGWFGFNAGSTTTGDTSIGLIALNTFLAAGAGAVGAMAITWLRTGKPDVSFTLNGVLAGLVGITAGCANLTPDFAIITGFLAGIIVVFAAIGIEKIGVDDPVDAIAVHGVCGAWGTLAAGLFNAEAMFNMGIVGVQLLGIVAAFAWTFPVAFVLFTLLKKTMGVRLNGEIEEMGLDLHEHAISAYPEFTEPVDENSYATV